MRDNGTITHKEYMLPAGCTIVSRTDLQGNIVSANDAFIEASGYAWTELVGQPHNILRHPDVPSDIFKDFWHTIKAGKPWSQTVKNRCKNGDHYWVVANATPIFENGKICGYMSVRTPATREQVAIAEEAYRDIKQGKLELNEGLPKSASTNINPFFQYDQTTITIILASLLLCSAFTPLLFPSVIETIPLIIFEISDLTFVGLIIASSIYSGKRLDVLTQKITSMSEGNFKNEFDIRGKNQLSRISSRLKAMQIKCGADLDDIKSSLASSQRIESALKSSSACVMVLDRFRSIIFLNDMINQLFTKLEPEIKKTNADFEYQKLCRATIDDLKLDIESQVGDLDTLKSGNKARVLIGSMTVDLMIDPTFDENGNRIGTVIEWKDMTEQLQIESNINTIIDGAAQGSLKNRIDTVGLSGFEAEISTSINRLMDNFSDLIGKIDYVFAKLTEGDLTERLEGEYVDELKNMQQATNKSLDNLAQTLLQVETGTNGIKHMSEEVATASEDLSQRTQEQAASLEETSATMEELTSTLQNTANNAIDANNRAHGTSGRASSGITIMQQTLDAMNGITDLSKKIGEITSVIDSIAFQTNLLALNAAVEAARAGEHGRGFAVVAGEVRNLAGKSAEAAKDISALISSAIEQIDSGTKLVENTNQVFSEMVASIEDVEKIISEVASTTDEQAKGVQQVNIAIRQLDEVTQQNAALVEELSSTAGNMSDEATLQNEFVSRFKFDHNTKNLALNSAGVSEQLKSAPTQKPEKAEEPKAESKKAETIKQASKANSEQSESTPSKRATVADIKQKQIETTEPASEEIKSYSPKKAVNESAPSNADEWQDF